MPYPQQVDYLESPLLRAPLAQAQAKVLVDYTGVGRPMFDCSPVTLRLQNAALAAPPK